MRVVLDTNIYVAAALSDGLSRKILEFLFESSAVLLIISQKILEELSDKLCSKFHWPQERVNFYLDDIKIVSEIVQSTTKLNIIKRDPKDNQILECALAGNADLIVTIDQDLIQLKHYKSIGIIHPKTFTWIFPEYFKKTKED